MKMMSFLLLFVMMGCATVRTEYAHEKINFTQQLEGKDVSLYTLRNRKGLSMTVCNYGGKIVSLNVPDRNGKMDDLVWGYDNLDDYLNPKKRITGSVVGRVAGRINGGKFTIDGREYQLHQVNERGFHAHGGDKGFDKVVWDVVKVTRNKITLRYLSIDGEEGYPGNLETRMTYELTDDNVFRIQYEASTDSATPVNFTHHSFFNLAGAGNESVEQHQLKINASHYLPILPTTINTGEIASVENTPLDYRKLTNIKQQIDVDHPQLIIGRGLDHTWVIDGANADGLNLAAAVYDPESGRMMSVYTNQPCVHIYTARVSESRIGKAGKTYDHRSAICVETMHYPDALNQELFPDLILRPGETHVHICEYRFSVR